MIRVPPVLAVVVESSDVEAKSPQVSYQPVGSGVRAGIEDEYAAGKASWLSVWGKDGAGRVGSYDPFELRC